MKLALLIGINYKGSQFELHGCVNDAKDLCNVLVEKKGYKKDNVVMLIEEDGFSQPTKSAIVAELVKIVSTTSRKDVEEIFIAYSGHGTQIKDYSGDEDDGMDEVLVPVDYVKSGIIPDDSLNSLLCRLDKDTKCIVLTDCCHSGTMLDLTYRYIPDGEDCVENKNCKVQGNVMLLSGCMDTQESADAWNINNSRKSQGAMTAAVLDVLRNNSDLSCGALVKNIRDFLKQRGFGQLPQLCSSKPIQEKTIFM